MIFRIEIKSVNKQPFENFEKILINIMLYIQVHNSIGNFLKTYILGNQLKEARI